MRGRWALVTVNVNGAVVRIVGVYKGRAAFAHAMVEEDLPDGCFMYLIERDACGEEKCYGVAWTQDGKRQRHLYDSPFNTQMSIMACQHACDKLLCE